MRIARRSLPMRSVCRLGQRGLCVALLALSPLAWGNFAPANTTSTDTAPRPLPYVATALSIAGSRMFTGACNDSQCHAPSGSGVDSLGSTAVSVARITFPDADGVDLGFPSYPDGMAAVSISVSSTLTSDGSLVARSGFSIFASTGTFVGSAPNVRYHAVGSGASTRSAAAATHFEPPDTTTATIYWQAPSGDGFEDQDDVTFRFCGMVVDGDAERTDDSTADCGSMTVQANIPPLVAPQAVAVATNAMAVTFTLSVTEGLSADPVYMSIGDLPTMGVVMDGAAVATTRTLSTSVLTYRPTVNIGGGVTDTFNWSVSDGVETREAIVTFTIGTAPASSGGGCAVMPGLGSGPSSTPMGLLPWLVMLALVLPWLRRRRASTTVGGPVETRAQ